jgi:hypothetical protein
MFEPPLIVQETDPSHSFGLLRAGGVLAAVSLETLERLPDDLLRKIFARLPRPAKDALRARLFGQADPTVP